MIDKLIYKIKDTIEQWKLILALASRPTPDEFHAVLKIVGLAMIVIGIIAYVIRVSFMLAFYR